MAQILNLPPEILIALASFFIGGIMWGARLESGQKQNARDVDKLSSAHEKLAEKHDTLDQKIMEKFSDVVQALARIEERLKSKQIP